MTNKDCNSSATPKKALGLNNTSGPLSRFKPALSARSALGRIAGIVLAVPVLGVPLSASAELLYTATFEKGIESWFGQEVCCDHSTTIVSSPVRYSGPDSRSLKLTFKKSDYEKNNSKRAELRAKPDPIGSERWYKLSMYVPSNWANTENGFIITQFHSKPDQGEESKISTLYLATDGKNLSLTNNWDSRRTSSARQPQGSQHWDLGALPKGRWVDYTYHIKWSYESDGILELFQDGKRVVKRIGPNCYNDQEGPKLKFGMYASGIRAHPEEYNFVDQDIYFDGVRIADSPI